MRFLWMVTAVVLLLGAVSSASAEQRMFVLCDFESEEEISRFSMRAISPFTLTKDHVSQGESGGRLIFPKWQEGKEQWPAAILVMRDGLPMNWTHYDTLAIDVRNESTHNANLAFHIRDTEGQTFSHHFNIPPLTTQTLRLNLDLVNANVATVREMHLFATRPPEEVSLVVDFLRLEEDSIPRLAAAEQRIAELRREAEQFALGKTFDEAEGACRSLRAYLAKEDDPDKRRELREKVKALEEQVRHQLTRAISAARMQTAFDKIRPGLPYACGFATSMEKVFPQDVPFSARVSRNWAVELAGNEVESFQLLVLAGDQELKDVQVAVSPLKRVDGVTSRRTPEVQVSPMGFVKTERPPYRVDYVGWHPDPILDFLTSVDIKSGEMQPIWIRIKTAPGTPAGDYTGDITITAANAPAVKLGLKVKVWGFDVPKETHLRTALSLREGTIRQVYGELTMAMWNKYCDFMLDYRLNPDNIYALNTPPLADILRWCSKGANAYNLIYAMRPANLKPNDPYPEDRKKHIMDSLETIVPKLKYHGIYDKAYLYGFDEVHADSHNAMKDIFSTIKAKYPDLPILTTAYEDTFGEASGLDDVDCWVPLTPKFDLARVERTRARGKEVWWYICIVPKEPYANWLIEYDAIDARSLMGLQTAKYRPDGFLYYAVNRWPLSKKPITEGPYTDWPPASFYKNNGDGSFVCAGPDGPLATIRMENIRDGIEDFEYFWVLEREIERLKSIQGPEARNALRRAETAAAIGDEVVRHLQDFSKDPQAIYAKRRQVAEAILAVQAVR